ncbi:MAG: leucine-rich repeat domain-containing protein [Mollicutes bacterium PWAP]|nr:leucine-rich repeat domain-containing protein [Mollicutes bacterium PWAP]
MKKRNKNLLSLGTLIATTSPLIAVIGCGSNSTQNLNKSSNQINPTNYFVVSEIKKSEFENSILPSDFFINSSITRIKEHSFKNAKLNNGFRIPANVKVIADNAFEGAILPHNFVIPVGYERAFIHSKLPDIWYKWSNSNTNGTPKDKSEIVSITNIVFDMFKGNLLSDSFKIPDDIKSSIVSSSKNSFVGTGYVWKVPISKNGIFSTTEFKLTQEKIIFNSYPENNQPKLISLKDQNLSDNVDFIEENVFKNVNLSMHPSTFISDILNGISKVTKFGNGAFINTGYVWKVPISKNGIISTNEFKLTQEAIDLNSQDQTNVVLFKTNNSKLFNNIKEVSLSALEGAVLNNQITLESYIVIKENAFKNATLFANFKIPNGATININSFVDCVIPNNYEWSNGSANKGSILEKI